MRALAPSSRVLTLAAGDQIFSPGEPGDSLYGVLEGSVLLSWGGAPEQGLISAASTSEPAGLDEILKAGDVFGAGALVNPGHHRINKAQAATPCRLLVMNRDEFLFALHESPVFSIEMLESLEERLKRRMTQR